MPPGVFFVLFWLDKFSSEAGLADHAHRLSCSMMRLTARLVARR